MRKQKRLNKRILLSTMTLTALFMWGCTRWAGFAPDQYDGQKIVRDEKAIEAFEERQEIVGKIKSLYLDEPFSEGIHQPTLSFEGTTEMVLEEKTYVIGEDLPSSRYLFAIVEPGKNSGNIRVEGAEGNKIADEYLDVQSGVITVELDLHEGNQLHVSGGERLGIFASATGELPEDLPISYWLAEMQSVTAEHLTTINTGIWEVGVQLSPGEYQFVEQPRTGIVYIFSKGETEPRIIEMQGTFTMEATDTDVVEASPSTSLTLEEGDKLYLHNAPSISIEKE